MGSTDIAIRERRAHPHWESAVGLPAHGTREIEELFVKAGVSYSVFQPRSAGFPTQGDARRRRPGSRRSTSAWTAYVAAARPAGGQDFPELGVAGSVQWLSSPSLVDDTRRPLGNPSEGAAVVDRQVILALPGLGGLKSSAGGPPPQGLGVLPASDAGAVRGCSHLVISSRAAALSPTRPPASPAVAPSADAGPIEQPPRPGTGNASPTSMTAGRLCAAGTTEGEMH